MPTKAGLTHKTTTKSIRALVNLHGRKSLNLEPAFQRQSVWSTRDRAKLIQSVLSNYPLPAIFLYTRKEDGKTIYDVIDGKQRIEALLHFMGIKRPGFELKLRDEETGRVEQTTWRDLKLGGQRGRIEKYKISVIQVGGAMSDIYDVFVRINSTGKVLTGQEKRNARYHSSAFLMAAEKIAKKFKQYFLDAGILSEGQLKRMKHIELVSEIMLSLERAGVINKKAALDGAMDPKGVDGRRLPRLEKVTITTLKRVKAMFPDLGDTRFCKVSDFYSLAYLIGSYEADGLVLIDIKRNRTAAAFLAAFGKSVDTVNQLQRDLKSVRSHDPRAREYLLTVREGTDAVRNRKNRHKILDDLLRSFFEIKDYRRNFSEEQRRLVWNSAARKKCSRRGCTEVLTWKNFTIDHIDPHSKGGKTALDNARLMCRKHNSAKGNRTRRRKGRK